MRIISGRARGTKLVTLEGLDTRPTTDRVKESLFNLLQYDFYDKHILDLFAGSGALGLEAMSRGATEVTFVDQNKACVEIIQKNIDKTRGNEQCKVIKDDVLSAIRKHKPLSLDLIFMDPPYLKGHILPALESILEANVLKDGGLVVIEHEKDDEWVLPHGLELVKTRAYGICAITIYRRTA